MSNKKLHKRKLNSKKRRLSKNKTRKFKNKYKKLFKNQFKKLKKLRRSQLNPYPYLSNKSNKPQSPRSSKRPKLRSKLKDKFNPKKYPPKFQPLFPKKFLKKLKKRLKHPKKLKPQLHTFNNNLIIFSTSTLIPVSKVFNKPWPAWCNRCLIQAKILKMLKLFPKKLNKTWTKKKNNWTLLFKLSPIKTLKKSKKSLKFFIRLEETWQI